MLSGGYTLRFDDSHAFTGDEGLDRYSHSHLVGHNSHSGYRFDLDFIAGCVLESDLTIGSVLTILSE